MQGTEPYSTLSQLSSGPLFPFPNFYPSIFLYQVVRLTSRRLTHSLIARTPANPYPILASRYLRSQSFGQPETGRNVPPSVPTARTCLPRPPANIWRLESCAKRKDTMLSNKEVKLVSTLNLETALGGCCVRRIGFTECANLETLVQFVIML
jgi:hypothetical protein